jgi:hypothetical protein
MCPEAHFRIPDRFYRPEVLGEQDGGILDAVLRSEGNQFVVGTLRRRNGLGRMHKGGLSQRRSQEPRCREQTLSDQIF